MSALTLFGVLVLTVMLIFYALEERAPVYVLLFAVSCAASSTYGFLQGAWPFGVVEAIWTGVALQRWRGRIAASGPRADRPIACDMTALSADERRRYDVLRARVIDAVTRVVPSADAFRLQIGKGLGVTDVAEWASLEHRCCPFLNISLSIEPDDGLSVQLGGSAAIKAFLRGEFGAILG